MKRSVRSAFCAVLASIGLSSIGAVPVFMSTTGLGLDHMVMTTWSDADGLASNTVLDVIQDKTGYIWVATYDGLTRFDGAQFKIFNKSGNEGYTSNSARVLAQSPDGTLWIGSNTDGLFAHSGTNFVKFGLNSGLPDLSVRALGVDARGKLWVGTTKGIASFDGAVFHVYDTKVKEAYGISNFFLALPNGRMLTGSNLPGLWLIGDDGLTPFKADQDLSAFSYSAAGLDASGSLWLGTSTGQIIQVMTDGSTTSFHSGLLSGSSVNSFFLRKDGVFMIATDRGIFSPDGNSFEVFSEEQGLSNNVVSSFWEDREGNIWLGTERGGLIKFSKGKFLSYAKREGLVSDSVNAVTEDSFGSVWIGTDEGLSFLPSAVDSYGKNPERTAQVDTMLQWLKTARIRQIRPEGDALWFATYTGDALIKFDGKTATSISQNDGLPINRVRMSYRDGAGVLWVATTAGLVSFNRGVTKHFGAKEGLPNDFVMDVLDDGKNGIWVATDGGGVASIRSGQIHNYSTKQGLAGDVVFRIFRDSRGGMWFCTSEGISLFDGGVFKNLGQREGLLSDTVFQMIEDSKGFVYMTTNRGLAVVALDELYQRIREAQPGITQRTYGRLEGLAGQPTANAWAYLNSKGVYYLPTTSGLAALDPSVQGPNDLVPPVLIEEVTVDGQPRPVYGMGLSLSPETQRLTIGFTALSYVVPEKVGFEYKLDGYEHDWVRNSGLRTISYTNLPAGNYVFRVRAWNEDGLINQRGAELTIVREPYWYMTPVAIGGLILLVLVFGFLINNIRVHAWRHRQKHLATVVEERTLELEREKARSEGLVRNLLPKHVADELLETGAATPKIFGPLSVLCAEVVNFNEVTASFSPTDLFAELGELFNAFDEICALHDCERLKTSGTVYHAICGLSVMDDQHSVLLSATAVDMMRFIIRHNQNKKAHWNIRIGIDSGTVSAGIVGTGKYLYDVFGAVVDNAFEICRSVGPDSISIGAETQSRIGEKYLTIVRKTQPKSYFLKYRDDLNGKSTHDLVELYKRAKDAYDTGNFHSAAETLEDIDLTISEIPLAHKVLKLKGNVYYKLGRRKLAEITWRRTLVLGVRDPSIEQNLVVIGNIAAKSRSS